MEEINTTSITGKSVWKWLLIRVGSAAALLLFINFSLTFTFHVLYPSDSLTHLLIPFQNHYLAFTDAFITSDDLIINTTADATILNRFFSYGVLVLLGVGILMLVLAIIPITRKVLPRLGFFLMLVVSLLVFIFCAFMPSTKTVFDKKGKKMVVTTFQYLIPVTQEFPFESIDGFDFSYKDFTKYSSIQHAEVVWVYTNVANQKILLGGNRIGTHAPHETKWIDPEKTKSNESMQSMMATLQKIVRGD